MEMTGVEPATSCLRSRRSPTELHPHHIIKMEAAAGFEPANKGFAVPCLCPLGYAALRIKPGAGDGIRTRDPQLGKLMLYP